MTTNTTALPPIVQDYVRYVQRAQDSKLSSTARIRNKHKALQAFSVMTAAAQRQALRVAGAAVLA